MTTAMRTGLPKADSRESVRHILAAAVRVFGSGGPGAVTHRAVAAEAGVSPGLTTYYFKDLNDLIYQALIYALEIESERLHQCAENAPQCPTLDDSVVVLTEMFFDKTVADPLYDLALFEMFLEATRNENVRELTRKWTELIAELTDAALPPTDPALDRSMVVQIVAAQIDGLMLEEASNQSLGLQELSVHLREVISRFLA